MIAYQISRALLGLVELALAVLLLRPARVSRMPAWTLYLAPFALLGAIEHLYPAFVEQARWWRAWWAPLAGIRVALAAAVSADLADYLIRTRVDRKEALLVGGWAISSAIALTMIAWAWMPQNEFQAFALALQYTLWLLTVVSAMGAFWWLWLRPLCISPALRTQVWVWVAQVALMAILASGTTGGLFWVAAAHVGITHDTGKTAWLALGISGQVGEIGCMSALAWTIGRRR